MQLQIELVAANGDYAVLPIHYNYLLQGLIYSMVKDKMPEIHAKGYAAGERILRLFVFSRLLGRVKAIKDSKIVFASPIKFKVGSPLERFIEVFAETVLAVKEIRLGDTIFWPGTIAVTPVPDFSTGKAIGRAISPVTVYSTLQAPDGKKKTYYYHPVEKEFGQQVKNNLLKKAAVLGINLPPDVPLELHPVNVKGSDMKVVYYKDTVIKGWLGKYMLTGDPQLIRLAFSAGIGAKNSQGFGMLEPVV